MTPLPYQPIGSVILIRTPWVEWEKWGSGADPERGMDTVWAKTAIQSSPLAIRSSLHLNLPCAQLLSSLGTYSIFLNLRPMDPWRALGWSLEDHEVGWEKITSLFPLPSNWNMAFSFLLKEGHSHSCISYTCDFVTTRNHKYFHITL